MTPPDQKALLTTKVCTLRAPFFSPIHRRLQHINTRACTHKSRTSQETMSSDTEDDEDVHFSDFIGVAGWQRDAPVARTWLAHLGVNRLWRVMFAPLAKSRTVCGPTAKRPTLFRLSRARKRRESKILNRT